MSSPTDSTVLSAAQVLTMSRNGSASSLDVDKDDIDQLEAPTDTVDTMLPPSSAPTKRNSHTRSASNISALDRPSVTQEPFVDVPASYVFNRLDAMGSVFFMDVRSSEDYQAGHVPSSASYDLTGVDNLNELTLDKVLALNRRESMKLKRHIKLSVAGGRGFLIIIGKGADSHKGDAAPAVLARLVAKECENKHNKEKLVVLRDGFQTFAENYPFLVCKSKPRERMHRHIPPFPKWPSEVFDQAVYLSSADEAKHFDHLTKLGITHIINCTDDIPNFHEEEHPESFKYTRLTLTDLGDPSSRINRMLDSAIPVLTSCFEETKDHSAGNARVLVHCQMGQSRSPSIIAGFLIKARGWSLERAHSHIKRRRPQININPEYLLQLEEVEQERLGFSTLLALSANDEALRQRLQEARDTRAKAKAVPTTIEEDAEQEPTSAAPSDEEEVEDVATDDVATAKVEVADDDIDNNNNDDGTNIDNNDDDDSQSVEEVDVGTAGVETPARKQELKQPANGVGVSPAQSPAIVVSRLDQPGPSNDESQQLTELIERLHKAEESQAAAQREMKASTDLLAAKLREYQRRASLSHVASGAVDSGSGNGDVSEHQWRHSLKVKDFRLQSKDDEIKLLRKLWAEERQALSDALSSSLSHLGARYGHRAQQKLIGQAKTKLAALKPYVGLKMAMRRGSGVSGGPTQAWSAAAPVVTISKVLPKSPAEAAGLQADDVLEAIDSQTVGNLADATTVLSALTPSTKVPVQVSRAGIVMLLVLQVQARHATLEECATLVRQSRGLLIPSDFAAGGGSSAHSSGSRRPPSSPRTSSRSTPQKKSSSSTGSARKHGSRPTSGASGSSGTRRSHTGAASGSRRKPLYSAPTQASKNRTQRRSARK